MSKKGAKPESKDWGQFHSNAVLVSLLLSLIIACPLGGLQSLHIMEVLSLSVPHH